MRAFNPERQLHRIEEAFGGAMTRLTEFRLLPACGIGNQGWTTNQACSAPPVDASEQAPAFTRGVVDLPVSCIRERTPTLCMGASTQETALGASRPSCRFPSPGNGQSFACSPISFFYASYKAVILCSGMKLNFIAFGQR